MNIEVEDIDKKIEEEKYTRLLKAVPFEMTDELESALINATENNLSIIQGERKELNFDERFDKNEDLYYGVPEDTDFPWENAANYFIQVPAMAVDIATVKTVARILDVPKIIKMEISEDEDLDNTEISHSDLADREDHLDYLLRKEVKLQDILHPVIRNGYKHGASVLSIPYVIEKEVFVYFENYDGNVPEDIEKYINNYSIELYNNKPKYIENLRKLQEGEIIQIKCEEEKVTINGVTPYQVELPNFWVRLKIKDLERQPFIGESMLKYWDEIDSKSRAGFYIKGTIEKLKEDYGKNYNDHPIEFMQCIIKTDLGGLLKNIYKIEYIYALEKRKIVKAFYYCYKHNDPHYVVFKPIPRDDRFIGDSFCEGLEDNTKMINATWNITVNSASISNAPALVTDDFSFNFSARDWKPMSVLKVHTGNWVKALALSYPKLDTIQLTNFGLRFSEMRFGISNLMSGRESTSDPTAPAAKTAMLLQESNLRLNEYIRCICGSIGKLARQIELLYFQFSPRYIKSKNKINKINVRYLTPSIVNNQDLDFTKIMKIISVIETIAPDILQDPNKRYVILREIINSVGGGIEKEKKIINPSPEEIEEEKLRKQLGNIINEAYPEEGAVAAPQPVNSVPDTPPENMENENENI